MVSDIINVFVYSSFGSWQFLSDAEWELQLTAWWFLVLACLYADWIVCFPYIETGKASEFGQLKDGYMFETSTGLSRMWEDVQLSYWFKQLNSNWQVFIRFFFSFYFLPSLLQATKLSDMPCSWGSWKDIVVWNSRWFKWPCLGIILSFLMLFCLDYWN